MYDYIYNESVYTYVRTFVKTQIHLSVYQIVTYNSTHSTNEKGTIGVIIL